METRTQEVSEHTRGEDTGDEREVRKGRPGPALKGPVWRIGYVWTCFLIFVLMSSDPRWTFFQAPISDGRVPRAAERGAETWQKFHAGKGHSPAIRARSGLDQGSPNADSIPRAGTKAKW